jgi:ribosomal protein L19E
MRNLERRDAVRILAGRPVPRTQDERADAGLRRETAEEKVHPDGSPVAGGMRGARQETANEWLHRIRASEYGK